MKGNLNGREFCDETTFFIMKAGLLSDRQKDSK
jgi:hypothetical protein